MKKIGLIILLLVTIGLLLGCGATTPTVAPSTAVPPTAAAVSDVTLKLGSWRPDDVVQMTQILAKFSEKHPHITVSFDPRRSLARNIPILRLVLTRLNRPSMMPR